MTPVELLQRLLRFQTVNPPGAERAAIEFLRDHLAGHGIEVQVLATDPERPNLVARLAGRGEAPPLLLHGHADVVTVAGQKWTRPPFEGLLEDGWVWGRGALDMKGGLAMMVTALTRARPAGDVLLAVVSDEEAGGVAGSRFLVERHPGLFAGVRHALGEFGGFSLEVAGRRLYPVMVAEKQCCRVTAVLRGPGGHGALRHTGGAMARLARLLRTLDRRRLPAHVTEPARLMVEGMAAALPGAPELLLRRLLRPRLTDRVLDLMGSTGRTLDPLLHNTVNATMVRGGGGGQLNVVPAEVTVQMDGRILPGLGPELLLTELRDLVGPGVELSYDQYDAGRSEVDMTMFENLAGVLRESDADGHPVPYLLPAVTDGRFLGRLGIQTYGFTPMRLPAGMDFAATIHAADERIPAAALEFGADAIRRAVERYRG